MSLGYYKNGSLTTLLAGSISNDSAMVWQGTQAEYDAADKTKLDGMFIDITDDEGSVTIDDELSATSTNPVQNKTITSEINDIKSDASNLKSTVETNTTNIDKKADNLAYNSSTGVLQLKSGSATIGDSYTIKSTPETVSNLTRDSSKFIDSGDLAKYFCWSDETNKELYFSSGDYETNTLLLFTQKFTSDWPTTNFTGCGLMVRDWLAGFEFCCCEKDNSDVQKNRRLLMTINSSGNDNMPAWDVYSSGSWVYGSINYSSSGDGIIFSQVTGNNSKPYFSSYNDCGTDLGTSSKRWNNIYASSGTIYTSDREKKKDIEYFDNDWADTFIDKLKPCTFKFKDGTSDRVHYGLIAQDVEEIFDDLGITSQDFAGFIKSQKLKFNRKEDGRIISTEKVEGEYDYSLRYDEFISLLVKKCQSLQAQIDELKGDK